MAKLAINGGEPVLKEKIKHKFPVTDQSDIDSVMDCFKNNSFSEFRAGTYDGGEKVSLFEHVVRSSVHVNYSVSFDTWSNGIIACLMACNIGRGDKVIVSPYTMTSCASSILACGAIPVFVDLDKTSLTFDKYDLIRKYDSRVKAMIVVHLFGIPSDMNMIMKFAGDRGISVIEDCAQAPKATFEGQYCGTIGDVGGFSLTQSKHVMSGEGGIAITNLSHINSALRIVRNHGEVLNDSEWAAEWKNTYFCKCTEPEKECNCEPRTLFGFNFRMTEMSAALAANQWRKIDDVIDFRRLAVKRLSECVSKYRFLRMFEPEYECLPSWYVFPFRILENVDGGVERKTFVSALNAEGFNFVEGYCNPLYHQNIYRKIANQHICFNVEDMYKKELVYTLDIRPPYDMQYIEKMCEAIEKVCESDEL